MDIATSLDSEWMKRELVGLLSRRSDLFAKVENLFWREGAPYEPGAVFKHFFSVVGGPAGETGHPVACVALRDENETFAALVALEDFYASAAHGDSLDRGEHYANFGGLSSA
jgi:hypothetical protein